MPVFTDWISTPPYLPDLYVCVSTSPLSVSSKAPVISSQASPKVPLIVSISSAAQLDTSCWNIANPVIPPNWLTRIKPASKIRNAATVVAMTSSAFLCKRIVPPPNPSSFSRTYCFPSYEPFSSKIVKPIQNLSSCNVLQNKLNFLCFQRFPCFIHYFKNPFANFILFSRHYGQ